MNPLAVSLGDPAGVGPELLLAAWTRRADAGLAPFFAVGGAGLLTAAARGLGLAVPIEPITAPEQAAECFNRALPVLADGAVYYAYQEGNSVRAAGLALATGAVIACDALGPADSITTS